jgi:hypothetical protein
MHVSTIAQLLRVRSAARLPVLPVFLYQSVAEYRTPSTFLLLSSYNSFLLSSYQPEALGISQAAHAMFSAMRINIDTAYIDQPDMLACLIQLLRSGMSSTPVLLLVCPRIPN